MVTKKSKAQKIKPGKIKPEPLSVQPPRKIKNPKSQPLPKSQQVQIELEMQNEALRQAQITLEESRDRYLDLYDFAPVGYLTLTREAMIAEVNLTAAALLGAERKKLLNCRFVKFVAPEDSERWHQYFMRVAQHGERQSCELSLTRGMS